MLPRARLILPTLGLVAACSSATAPRPTPSGPLILRRISGPIPDDTAIRNVLDPIVYELVDHSGTPAPGVAVRFHSGDSTAGRAGPGTPFVWISTLEDHYASNLDLRVPADENGRVAVLVSRGTHAGIGWLVVGVDSLGLADSMSFRILMMSPREVRLVPQDTTILAGASFLIRAYAVDVAGNTDSSSAVIRTDSAAVTVDSGVITGRAIGTATIDASFHSVATHATVSVVPDGHFLTIGRANGAVSIARTRTDGTERQVIYAEPASLVAPWSMDWIDPTSLVLPNPSGSGLLRVGLDGAATPIAIAVPPDSRHVQWVASAHDGRTVYFAYQVNLAEIWKADLISGSASLVLGSNFQAIDTYPSISPDGRLLLFTTTRGFGIATIGLLDLFSGGPPRLLGLRGVDARWFPDGQHFAYIAAPYLKVSGLDGSDQRYLTPVGATAGVGFNRSTDGQWIAIPGGPRITFVNVATGLTIAGPSAASVEWILWQ